MKTKFAILIWLLFAIFSIPHQIRAQSISEWQPIFLNVAGDNKMNGLEASFQENTCTGEDVIFIRFINHNSYPVKVEWFDGVFTQELKWINKEKDADKKSLTLAANIEAKGECTKKLYPELFVEMKSFIADKKNFKRYMAAQLMVTAVQ
jgi:hypothetical protein